MQPIGMGMCEVQTLRWAWLIPIMLLIDYSVFLNIATRETAKTHYLKELVVNLQVFTPLT